MNIPSSIIKHITYPLGGIKGGLLLLLLLLASCSDDNEVQHEVYGYAQFEVIKAGTRAAGDQLDNLSEAKKVRVVLTHNGDVIAQTLPLRCYNEEVAEYGLQSDKLQLVAGRYTVSGFYLYDRLDREIYSSDCGATFDVAIGGMHLQTLEVNAQLRGQVTFRLGKKFVETRADDETSSYPFANIRGASVTVTNLFTHETHNIEKMRVKIKEELTDGLLTTCGDCDTTVWLPTGTYQVTAYTTFSDQPCRYPLETTTVTNAPTFVVKANAKTENAPVPVVMSKMSERIKDYYALKAIWEALDGPNWKYRGESATPGTNWDFDKDIDLWGDQPGVSIDDEGRVTVLSLIGFGARGVVPDEIGQLTRLRVLYLGAHDEKLGGMTGSDLTAFGISNVPGRKEVIPYETLFLSSDVRENMSEPLREHIDKDPNQRPIRYTRINPKDVQIGYLTNQITGISRAVKRCTGMQQFYIANSPITTDGFFRDISPDSPFYDEDLRWENFDNMMDVEIYNCPKLTGLPMEMLAHLGTIQVLNISCNPNISGSQLKADWEVLIDGTIGSKVQALYMGYNSLEETPTHDNLVRMSNLSAIDLSNNRLHTLHPFGKEINLVKGYFNSNRLTEVPYDENGYFSDFIDVEILNFAFNQLTEVPDIFNARSVYTIESVNLSHNMITGLQHGASFKGINANSIDLSYNPFKEFPKEIFSTGSPVSYLIMSGCGLTEIPKGSMVGPKSSYIRSLDFSLNKLKELTTDFYAENIPYLYGIDLSGNQFEYIPYQPLDCYSLTVLILRNQRDDAGNRTLKQWLTGIYQHPQLTALYLGSNDLRKIDDTISPNIRVFEIKDNPNISIDMSGVCPYITAGYYQLFYDKTQDIRGCPALGIEN